MGFRKIIGFGGNSFVISLPKTWITSLGLKKGDLVSINEDDEHVLRVMPENVKPVKQKTEITLEFTNIQHLKSQLVYTYITNYDTINIVGTGLDKHISDIRREVQNFVALEIMNYTDKNIVLKDFLNITDISVYEVIRKIDRLILLMADDTRQIIKGDKSKDLFEQIEQKEMDINKLCNLIFKVSKLSFNPVDRNTLKLTLDDVFYYWELALFLEKVADQIKRIPRYVKGLPIDEDLIKTYNKLMDHYSMVMKANFLKKVDLAVQVMVNKQQIAEECDEHRQKLSKDYGLIIEKMKTMNTNIGNLAKVLLKLSKS
ncbi:MAG: AbrB/MazE/SpoVT family DNA-binding domain-containing protein [Nanoarchaeota archaeon]